MPELLEAIPNEVISEKESTNEKAETAELRNQLVQEVSKTLQTVATDIAPYIEELMRVNVEHPSENEVENWKNSSKRARILLQKIRPALDMLDPLDSQAGAYTQLRQLIHDVVNQIAPLLMAFQDSSPSFSELTLHHLQLAPEKIKNEFPIRFKEVVSELGESESVPLSLGRIINAAQEEVSQELPLDQGQTKPIEITNMLMNDGPLIKKPWTLRNVLHELIYNAVKAELARGGTYVTIDAHQDEDHTDIVVVNDGASLPPEIEENPFAPNVSSHDYGLGSGNGLSLARKTMPSAKIDVVNTPGKTGVTATIHLPPEAVFANN